MDSRQRPVAHRVIRGAHHRQERPARDPGAGCSDCLHAYDPYKHTLLGEEDQLDDSRCQAILPMVSQMVDFPESLQLMEDGRPRPTAACSRSAGTR